MLKDNINKVSGVYKIVNLINNKFYVGSAVNLYDRYYSHKASLKKGRHKNSHLQNAFNKYGEENFKFIVLEECEIKDILIREQYYKDLYKSYDREVGYDICKIAGNSLGVKRSEEFKEKQRLIQTGMKHVSHSQETKNKIGLAHKGMKHSEETKEIIRNKNKKFSPTKEQRIKNSESHKKYFRENGSSKLTYFQVLEIKELFESGLKLKEIANKFNVSLSTIKAIKYKRNWK